MPSKLHPQVVVITDRLDAHLPFVQRHIEHPLIVIDPLTILEGLELTYEIKTDNTIVSYKGKRLNAVTGVWYRKPREIRKEDLNVPEEYELYSMSAMQYHVNQLLSCFQGATWVSDYYAIRKANNKIRQLEIAARVGFNTPRTLMTSDSGKARAFIRQEGNCIVKAHLAYSTASAAMQKSFLATKVSAQEMPNLKNLHLAPAIFQQYIKAKFDVRVTVIGEQAFPSIILTGKFDPESNVRDWRLGHYQGEMSIEAYNDFPEEVARMCVAHVKAMGLNYGAIDLVMDTQGRLWFLENNPNGQWAFIEEATGQAMGKAMADLLTGMSSRSKL